MADKSISENDQFTAAQISYIIESTIYALAMLLGIVACCYTSRRFNSNCRRHIVLAARLVRFKISLTVADLIVLYVYAPTQIIWITTYNWYGGDFLCRATKFINTFSLHLTANMQVLIAADRLYITTHLRQIHQKSHFATNQMITLAWILAIACALPQFFVFHVYVLPDGKPQCVSVWTVMRFREYLQQEVAQKHHLKQTPMDWITTDINITFAKGFDHMSNVGDISLVNSDTLKVFEHEMGTIRRLDKNGKTQQIFSHQASFPFQKQCGVKQLEFTAEDISECAEMLNKSSYINHCSFGEVETKLLDNINNAQHCWFQRTKHMSRNFTCKFSIGDNPSTGDLLRHWDANTGTNDASTIDISGKSNRKRNHPLSMPTLKLFNRRCNETLAIEEAKQRRSSVAWKNTVALARRKTRRKVRFQTLYF
uniref:G_PROTEIN_RECEP_F1_2 domain-containing protein n=1 Tax=Loa loa TaxID=7209 RepID=A0A1I7VEV8_LOALO